MRLLIRYFIGLDKFYLKLYALLLRVAKEGILLSVCPGEAVKCQYLINAFSQETDV
jgi:hypothetical protein